MSSDRAQTGLESELESFRLAWRNEVRSKPHQQNPTHPTDPSSTLLPSPNTTERSPTRHRSQPATQDQVTHQIDSPTSSPVRHRPTQNALEVYSQAIAAEKEGRLDLALKLYRRAFKLDDNIDRIYASQGAQKSPTTIVPNLPTSPSSSSAHFHFQVERHLGPAFDHSTPTDSSTAQLEEELATTEDQLIFQQAEEGKEVLLERLPFEIATLVVRALGQAGDFSSISSFSRVSKKAFVLSNETSIWKEICALIYRPPQLPEPMPLGELVIPYGNYRDLLIRRPRIRMDGVYISVCHYLRPGVSENLSWIDPVHLITYHRLLRFFSDGTVLSCLSTEHPSTLVPKLSRQHKEKGTHFGLWQLDEGEVHLTELFDSSAAKHKYMFEMKLSLNSTTRGRWNKLTMDAYYSTHMETGEEVPIKLFHQKPFHFSKVRSYPAFG